MDAEALKKRTKQFGIRVIRLVEALPKTRQGDILGRQLLRSGTSVGANYRSACRARSRAEFISKVDIAIEEADESIYWIELMIETGMIQPIRVADLVTEANEIVAIQTASAKTAIQNLSKN